MTKADRGGSRRIVYEGWEKNRKSLHSASDDLGVGFANWRR
jgi:hypothetical protein